MTLHRKYGNIFSTENNTSYSTAYNVQLRIEECVTKAEYNMKGDVVMYTDYGYIGDHDGVLYVSSEEAIEADPRNWPAVIGQTGQPD